MTFGDRLREARLRRGLTQEKLAKEIGVAKSTLTGYEKGNREPDISKIRRILEILDVDADYLLGVWKMPEEPAVDLALTFEARDGRNNARKGFASPYERKLVDILGNLRPEMQLCLFSLAKDLLHTQKLLFDVNEKDVSSTSIS